MALACNDTAVRQLLYDKLPLELLAAAGRVSSARADDADLNGVTKMADLTGWKPEPDTLPPATQKEVEQARETHE